MLIFTPSIEFLTFTFSKTANGVNAYHSSLLSLVAHLLSLPPPLNLTPPSLPGSNDIINNC